MSNITLLEDEVVLYEGTATSNEYKGSLHITLTSYQMVIEKEKGFFKKEIELVDTISLEDIKTYNDVAQIKQKGGSVEIQTKAKNITLSFSGMFEARKNVSQVAQKLRNTFSIPEISEVLHLTVGGCGVCEVCAKKTGEPCRAPELAMASLEAYGVNVSKLAEAAGMKYINGKDTVTYFGAVLFCTDGGSADEE